MVIGTNHHDHLVGEEAAYGLYVGRRVALEIKELVVDEGVQNAKDITCLIDTFSRSLYSGPISNRRFFPTMQKSHWCCHEIKSLPHLYRDMKADRILKMPWH